LPGPSDRHKVPTIATLGAGPRRGGVASGTIKPEVLLAPPPRGRPTDYSPELADLVCQRLMEAGTLLEACDKHPELPHTTTVYRWLQVHEDFRIKYSRAREDVMEMWADEIVRVANDQTLEPNDRRVKIDTKKWLMSKIAYRRYGDKLIHAGDPENPILMLHKKAEMAPLTPSQLALLERFAQERLTVIDAEAEPEGDGGRVPISPLHPGTN
jgi:hypothetical protein